MAEPRWIHIISALTTIRGARHVEPLVGPGWPRRPSAHAAPPGRHATPLPSRGQAGNPPTTSRRRYVRQHRRRARIMFSFCSGPGPPQRGPAPTICTTWAVETGCQISGRSIGVEPPSVVHTGSRRGHGGKRGRPPKGAAQNPSHLGDAERGQASHVVSLLKRRRLYVHTGRSQSHREASDGRGTPPVWIGASC